MIARSNRVGSLFDKVRRGSIEADDIIDAIFCMTCWDQWDLLSMFYALSLYRFLRVVKDIPSAIYRLLNVSQNIRTFFFTETQ